MYLHISLFKILKAVSRKPTKRKTGLIMLTAFVERGKGVSRSKIGRKLFLIRTKNGLKVVLKFSILKKATEP